MTSPTCLPLLSSIPCCTWMSAHSTGPRESKSQEPEREHVELGSSDNLVGQLRSCPTVSHAGLCHRDPHVPMYPSPSGSQEFFVPRRMLT